MGIFHFLKKPKSDAEQYYEDVFSITGRGTVVTGRVAVGAVAEGGTVKLKRTDGTARQVTVTGTEKFRKICGRAVEGDNVGLLLRGVERAEVSRGDILEK